MEDLNSIDPAKGDPNAPAVAAAPDAAAPDAAAPDAAVAAANESLLAKLEAAEKALKAEVERAVERVEAVVHTIEHRTFGRASADEPMPTTTITGN